MSRAAAKRSFILPLTDLDGSGISPVIFLRVHYGQFSVHLPPVSGSAIVRFFVASKVDKYRAFSSAVTGKYAPLTVQTAIGGVEALYGIRGVNHRSYIAGKLEDRTHRIPVVVATVATIPDSLLKCAKDLTQPLTF